MIAWQKSNPRRVVQLFAPGAHAYALDSATIVATGTTATTGTLVQLPPTVLFIDGDGALYGGVSTTQDISVTPSTTPCSTSDANLAVTRVNFTCTQADFTVAFDATTSLNPLVGLFAHDSVAAHREHRGARRAIASRWPRSRCAALTWRCRSCAARVRRDQPGAPPPVTVPQRDSLTATLTAAVGSDVTFTFTVKNTRSTSVDVHFNDGQQYDFRRVERQGRARLALGGGQGLHRSARDAHPRARRVGELRGALDAARGGPVPGDGVPDQLLARGGGVHDRLGALSHS